MSKRALSFWSRLNLSVCRDLSLELGRGKLDSGNFMARPHFDFEVWFFLSPSRMPLLGVSPNEQVKAVIGEGRVKFSNPCVPRFDGRRVSGLVGRDNGAECMTSIFS